MHPTQLWVVFPTPPCSQKKVFPDTFTAQNLPLTKTASTPTTSWRASVDQTWIWINLDPHWSAHPNIIPLFGNKFTDKSSLFVLSIYYGLLKRLLTIHALRIYYGLLVCIETQSYMFEVFLMSLCERCHSSVVAQTTAVTMPSSQSGIALGTTLRDPWVVFRWTLPLWVLTV